MLKFVTRAAVAAAVVLSASTSFAATLFDSGHFESYSTGVGGGGAPLTGQFGWAEAPAITGAGAGNIPGAFVYPYLTPTPPNFKRVQVQAADVLPTQANYFFPTANLAGYTPAVNEGIAIQWTQAVITGNNNPFFGITAYGNGGYIGQLGIDGSTGALIGGDVTVSPFTATTGVFYNYELLLNFTTQTYSLFTGVSGGSVYTLRATGAFATANTAFTDADISVYGLSPTGNYSGAADFDYYTVSTVVIPEPASLGLGGLALGLLAARRRRGQSA